MRIGMGYDVHRLESGRRLVLGGVEIKHSKGLWGHSDADVLTHAICDALLGAAGLGDIGCHFPDTDPAWADIDSLVLLSKVKEMIGANWTIVNLDATVVAQEPKISPFRDEIRSLLADKLAINPSQVNIKATTEEGMGPIGRKEGIAAHCIVLLRSNRIQAV